MRTAVFGALLFCVVAQGAEPKIGTNSIGMELIEIPAGKFQMGDDGGSVLGDKASVAVTLTKPFLLGKTEVTQGQWEQVMGTEPWSRFRSRTGYPATQVSWDDATAFCEKLTQRERENGKLPENEEYRLPTEAEWEYACRAGTTTAYSFGDDASKLGDFAWFDGNSGGVPHAVGTKQANPWGLHDMHGNVSEWCSDKGGMLAGGVNPIRPGKDTEDDNRDVFRMVRGGGWFAKNDQKNVYADNCLSAHRAKLNRAMRSDALGFRVARSQAVQ